MAFNLPARPGSLDTPISVPITSPQTSSRPVWAPLSPAVNMYNRFWAWRKALDLPNPGSVENLTKEVKSTHLTNVIFDGARADLAKVLSVSPIFQVTHSFTLASQTQEPTYSFGSVFIGEKTFLHGNVDHEGNLSGRFTQQWSSSHATKGQMQLSNSAERGVLQLEHENSGLDYCLNLKAINPSPLDGSGAYIASYLQSVNKRVALGVEGLFHRVPEGSEMAATWLAKYTGGQSNDWVATAQFQPSMGLLATSYWHKLSPQVEVAADLQLMASPVRREALATTGIKWETRLATFRAQLDSTGKLSAMLEQRFASSLLFLLTGEIDHFKNAAKVGVGIQIESSPMTDDMGLPPQM